MSVLTPLARRTTKIITGIFLVAFALILAPTARADDAPAFLKSWGIDGSKPGEFRDPQDIAVDGAGNVYVADTRNFRIQKFTASGTFLKEWKVEKDLPPTGIAISPNGFVYVTATVKGVAYIVKYDTGGGFLDKWGGPDGSGPGEFRDPQGIAVDDSGCVYVADTGNFRIQKLTESGTFLLEWGSQGSGDGQFAGAYGIAVSPCGDVYVIDSSPKVPCKPPFCVFPGRVQKFDRNGTYLTQWGSGGSGDGQFSGAQGIATDACGFVYVADTENHRIQKFDGNGVFVAKWGTSGTGNGQFRSPYGVTVDAGGHVYVTDTQNDRVQKFTSEGIFVLMWGSQGKKDGQFSSPIGIAAASDGTVYVADTYNNRIQKFDNQGRFLRKWGSGGSADGEFSSPEGIAVDGNGIVYVADTWNFRVQKFDGEGVFLGQWGSQGSGPGEFYFPRGIAVNAQGDVLVVDAGNCRIQAFDGNGGFLSEWGSYGPDPGQFLSPAGVAVDGNGAVYVVEQKYCWVQKFDSDGTFLARWGAMGSGDGQFMSPWGVAVSPSGHIYVTDRSNSRVQKFDDNGVYLTGWGVSGSGPGQFRDPRGIAIDASGCTYVVDSGNHRVQKFRSLAPQPVDISGVVTSDCVGPLAGVTVDVLDPLGDFHTTVTGADGGYTVANVPYSPCLGEVSIVVPLGFQVISPPDGHSGVWLTEDATVDFSLSCLSVVGDARSMGYWKHQAAVYVYGRGSAQESQADMEVTFPQALFNHFHENVLNGIAVEGVTFMTTPDGPAPVTLETILTTLEVSGGKLMLERAKQQYLAFLLNVASGKVMTFAVVSADGYTSSQALQYVAGLILDGNPANDEAAKNIAETINIGAKVAAGVIPPDYDYIAYAPRVPQYTRSLAVFPNPGGALRTFSIGTTMEGPATIEIFDVHGRRLVTPFSGSLGAGMQTIVWDGRLANGDPVSRGVYWARFNSPAGTQSVKLVVVER